MALLATVKRLQAAGIPAGPLGETPYPMWQTRSGTGLYHLSPHCRSRGLDRETPVLVWDLTTLCERCDTQRSLRGVHGAYLDTVNRLRRSLLVPLTRAQIAADADRWAEQAPYPGASRVVTATHALAAVTAVEATLPDALEAVTFEELRTWFRDTTTARLARAREALEPLLDAGADAAPGPRYEERLMAARLCSRVAAGEPYAFELAPLAGLTFPALCGLDNALPGGQGDLLPALWRDLVRGYLAGQSPAESGHAARAAAATAMDTPALAGPERVSQLPAAVVVDGPAALGEVVARAWRVAAVAELDAAAAAMTARLAAAEQQVTGGDRVVVHLAAWGVPQRIEQDFGTRVLRSYQPATTGTFGQGFVICPAAVAASLAGPHPCVVLGPVEPGDGADVLDYAVQLLAAGDVTPEAALTLARAVAA